MEDITYLVVVRYSFFIMGIDGFWGVCFEVFIFFCLVNTSMRRISTGSFFIRDFRWVRWRLGGVGGVSG